MFRKYKVTVAAILTVVILITVTFLGFGLTTGSALAAENTMDYYDWFDLETGTVGSVSPGEPPPNNDFDFCFLYNALIIPHAVLKQNQYQGVEIAYSEEDYANVWLDDVLLLDFTTDVTYVPFNKVAVIRTAEGNYFKIGLVSEAYPNVTFQWDQLVFGYDAGYEAGYQAGQDDSAETIDDFLEEIKNLLATPPGQRISESSYQGDLGAELNEIIEMLLAPQGSNISETTPHGKKK